MNKILYLTTMVIAAGMFLLMSCQGNRSTKKHISQSIADSLKGHCPLVVYFSRAGENYIVGKVKKGNTAYVAEEITELTGADIYEIKAVKDYESLSYEEMLATVREEHEQGTMPEFTTDLRDTKKYDVIFIGGPVWWGTYPRVMQSFFRKFNLNSKILIPFTTHEGSGLGNTKTELQNAYPDATILDGFSITGHEAQTPQAHDAIRQWLESLSFNANVSRTSADAVTGATRLHKDCTSLGEAMSRNRTASVKATYRDGREEELEMVVYGSVDMGDGLLWSATNLGASEPWKPGDHYAWGETAPKKSYTESNYAYLNKNIGDDISHTWYDAASVTLGGDWHIPTYEQWHTLLRNCEHEFVTINGIKGHLLKAGNGNLLFIPGNGYVYDEAVGTPNEGFYWAATVSDSVNAYVTYLPENSWGQSNYGRYIGIGIRPVRTNNINIASEKDDLK